MISKRSLQFVAEQINLDIIEALDNGLDPIQAVKRVMKEDFGYERISIIQSGNHFDVRILPDASEVEISVNSVLG